MNTNSSQSISFSIFDENQLEIFIDTNLNYSFEIIIPRNRNFILPPLMLQNVTHLEELFSMKSIDIQQNDDFRISIHFEIHPLNRNLSYLFIYKFDQALRLTNSVYQLDGWTVFCSPSK